MEIFLIVRLAVIAISAANCQVFTTSSAFVSSVSNKKVSACIL